MQQEVVDAVSSFKPYKSPGLDGIHPFFYQKYWYIVGSSLKDFCTNVFTAWTIPLTINETFNCLIPKFSYPSTINQYRPISLCNTTYKIITKIIVNRMKPLLNDLIGPTQSSFLTNRQASDNAFLVQEILHFFKTTKGRQNFMLAKIDLEKAFDRLEWSTPSLVSKFHVSSSISMPSQVRRLASSNLNSSFQKTFFPVRRCLMRNLGDPLLEHVYREQNKLAHALTRTNVATTTQLFWEPPASVEDILIADKNGGLSCRRVRIQMHDQLVFNNSNVVNTRNACTSQYLYGG
ncbi:hypothetical protein FXO38_11360 [Capsicum annuum]|nr:hypothetical protein FXO38_11360 [Capsicum annuum]